MSFLSIRGVLGGHAYEPFLQNAHVICCVGNVNCK
jgi:hypothetical protein